MFAKHSYPYPKIYIYLFLLFFLFSQTSCMVTRVAESQVCDTVANNPNNKKTTWNFFWGLVQPKVVDPNCQSKKLHMVASRTNLGFALITTITLGIVAPQRVEWCCAQEAEEPTDTGNGKKP